MVPAREETGSEARVIWTPSLDLRDQPASKSSRVEGAKGAGIRARCTPRHTSNCSGHVVHHVAKFVSENQPKECP